MSKETPPVSIKDFIRAVENKKISAQIILEVEGRFYQAASVETLSGDLVIIHSRSNLTLDWGFKSVKAQPHGRISGAVEKVSGVEVCGEPVPGLAFKCMLPKGHVGRHDLRKKDE